MEYPDTIIFQNLYNIKGHCTLHYIDPEPIVLTSKNMFFYQLQGFCSKPNINFQKHLDLGPLIYSPAIVKRMPL